ncbi:MAG: hypothetical protein AVDCRST_MAG03-2339 [uncultured Rubrobacteraceae bacterium]|uniref:DoxX family protein n=1 Tax=uncultured Rubrobacteraceae bacterium TaxID=349277 RepID=A0A6J4PRQ8_9ACTN|nr:MAG: hypothetical protein AVDCRST_MAG03-2339 [uncultured Rubrobacteraceae bacterium]
MNTALWVAQIMLAFLFLAHGLMYLYPPDSVSKVLRKMPFSIGFFRFLGIAEVLAAPGLTLPGWTGLLPWLTPLAATGLALIVGGAAVFHLREGEWLQAFVTAAVFALVAFVAVTRWFVIPL